ncbi:restriction endonuclease [Piscibacillus sp. B03]|uniref:restriction endonuclease n=1 Tax=Piscibacillus sp. B03 TaxID=3457430 RepID=UPI003FCE4E34
MGFKQAGIEHTVLIECKNYTTNLTLEKVRNFFGVLHDIGNAQGIIVTKTGYQSGAAEFAKFYGISLKVLRRPNDEDWEGRIKDIHINIIAKTLASSEDKPLSVQMFLRAENEEQRVHLQKFQEYGRLNAPSGPDLQFLDKNGQVVCEEIRWWLPKHIDTLNKEDGGPYSQDIKLEDKYVLINEGEQGETLVAVDGLKVTYYVESYSNEVISHGEQIVEAILKEFNTNDVEYVKRKR